MELGLKRGIVQIVDHQSGWAAVFETEREHLKRALDMRAVEIEHVGSTAVEGLRAKPIIDIAIAARAGEVIASWQSLLEPLGYEYFGDREGRADYFFAKGPDECRTIYLHVVPEGCERWDSYLEFRDRLRRDPRARAEYEALKASLAARSPSARQPYTEGKCSFIEKVTAL